MELNTKDALLGTDSDDAQPTLAGVGEIELYGELTAFTELSPEEQMRLLDHSQAVSAEPGVESADQTQEKAAIESLLNQAPIEPVEEDTAAMTTAPLSAEEAAEEHTSPEEVLVNVPIEPTGGESAASESGAKSAEPGAESGSHSGALRGYSKPGKISPERSDGSRPSGPLSGFLLTPDFVFTGALSRGVCLACGADAGTDDLFCVACGVFIDEIASTLPFNPTCTECKQGITAGEIFCPWCGASLPA